jgi:hypothetical protein
VIDGVPVAADLLASACLALLALEAKFLLANSRSACSLRASQAQSQTRDCSRREDAHNPALCDIQKRCNTVCGSATKIMPNYCKNLCLELHHDIDAMAMKSGGHHSALCCHARHHHSTTWQGAPSASTNSLAKHLHVWAHTVNSALQLSSGLPLVQFIPQGAKELVPRIEEVES